MGNKFSHFLFNLYRYNETQLHQLKYLFWECTRRCNLNCLHCGSDCSADAGKQDMPFDDFLNAALPFTPVNTKERVTVAITGGEPTLREDLPECGRRLRELGFAWGMVTNGWHYTSNLHSRLMSAGMGSITVSLDGLEASHNWLRGSAQSFGKAVSAIDIIASSPLTYDIVTCVNQRNIGELELLKDFLIKRKVKAWRLFTISPIGRAAENEELRLSPEQLRRLMDFIARSRQAGEDRRIKVYFSCEAYTGDYEGRVRDGYFFCHAGINIGSVLYDGSISACPNIDRHFIQGNIYRDNFQDVWDNRFEVMRKRNWTKTGVCKKCRDYGNCKGGAMHLWNGKRDVIMRCIHTEMAKG
jgi:radical SAM enzyme (rSAM/lipoprotein system)